MSVRTLEIRWTGSEWVVKDTLTGETISRHATQAAAYLAADSQIDDPIVRIYRKDGEPLRMSLRSFLQVTKQPPDPSPNQPAG